MASKPSDTRDILSLEFVSVDKEQALAPAVKSVDRIDTLPDVVLFGEPEVKEGFATMDVLDAVEELRELLRSAIKVDEQD